MKPIYLRHAAFHPKSLLTFAGWAAVFLGVNLVASGLQAEAQEFSPGANGSIISLAVQSDGKAVFSGNFTRFNDLPVSDIIRLNTDGSLDQSFQLATDDSRVESARAGLALQPQPDGKLLVFGANSETFIGVQKDIIRLNADGSFDASFTASSSLDYKGVGLVTVQPDGKLLLDTGFTRYGGASTGDYHLTRLKTHGREDPDFQSVYFENPELGYPFGAQLSAIAVQADGKILVAGNFTTINGTQQPGLGRLNVDGSLDNSFRPAIVSDSSLRVSTIFLRPDGAIFISGSFQTVNGVSRVDYALLNADGSLNADFTLDAALADASASPVGIQSDGKIIVGRIEQVDEDHYRARLLRLNVDGSLDPDFASIITTAKGTSAPQFQTRVGEDGKIVIAGKFAAINGTARNSVARLNADGSVDPGFQLGLAVVTVAPFSNGFTITRAGGDDSLALTVSYEVTGNAAPDVDYTALKGTFTFKAGRTSKAIRLKPLTSAAAGKKVKLILSAGDGYTIGANNRAKVLLTPGQ